MTFSSVLAAIAGLGAIATAFSYFVKFLDEKFSKSPAQQDADIDRKMAEERKKSEDTGRPV